MAPFSIPTAILTLDDGTTISGGGTLSIGGHGELDVEVGAVQGGNSGFGSSDATLDGVAVTNDGTIDVDLKASGAILALDDGTTITGGALSIGGSGTLEITYGASGAGATLDGVQVGNAGTIQVGTNTAGDPTLTLDDGTTTTGGTLSIGGGDTLDIEAGTVNGLGATLSNVNVLATDLTSTITVGNGATLKLIGTDIGGGTLNFVGSGDTLSSGINHRVSQIPLPVSPAATPSISRESPPARTRSLPTTAIPAS